MSSHACRPSPAARSRRAVPRVPPIVVSAMRRPHVVPLPQPVLADADAAVAAAARPPTRHLPTQPY
uniref:Uncharacterized protein n=1 Tax=Oryza sativa subsp. japonica TaxID=39947 RepID=Q6Z1L2_ORYSJ|nr:hypothetical protein [Oryza sativa Japonica Group]BAC99751.1 hypothetical protein [Oryza sativa Japonica Group]